MMELTDFIFKNHEVGLLFLKTVLLTVLLIKIIAFKCLFSLSEKKHII